MKTSLTLLLGSLSLVACSSMPMNNTSQPNQTKTASVKTPSSGEVLKVPSRDGSYTGEIIGNYKSSPKFSKLEIGMSKRQVEDLIGAPTDQRGYQTGKAWIPVAGAFSKDQYRIQTYYKGEGRLVYAKNGEKLFRIEVDRSEDGYQ